MPSKLFYVADKDNKNNYNCEPKAYRSEDNCKLYLTGNSECVSKETCSNFMNQNAGRARKLKDSDNDEHYMSFSWSRAYQTDPTGSKNNQRVETLINGKKKTYNYEKTTDNKGNVISQKGTPFTYQEFKKELDSYDLDNLSIGSEGYSTKSLPRLSSKRLTSSNRRRSPASEATSENPSPRSYRVSHLDRNRPYTRKHRLESRKTSPFTNLMKSTSGKQSQATVTGKQRQQQTSFPFLRRQQQQQHQQQKQQQPKQQQRNKKDDEGFNPLKWISW